MNPAISDLYNHLGHKQGLALKFVILPRDDTCKGAHYRTWFSKIWVPFGESVHQRLHLHDYDPMTFALHPEEHGWDEVQGLHWHNAKRHGYDHVLIVKHDGTDRKYQRGLWIVSEAGNAMRPEMQELGDMLDAILTRQKVRIADTSITEDYIRCPK